MIKRISIALKLPFGSLHKWAKILSIFILGQGAVQVIQLLSGFFLIRWLSVEDYAQYSVAFAFQSTAQMLVEFGFSGAIVALVGDRINDKKVIGNYIKAGQFFRNRFFLFVGGTCIVLFPLLTAKHQWSLPVTLLLLFCILINLYFSGNISYYTPPLNIHKKIGILYQVQVKNGLFRFLLIAAFYLASVLNAWLAALTTSFLTISNGLAFRKKARPYIEEPESASPEVRKEMFKYIRPIMPGIIFAAFQGQIMIFIISIFGETESIAEIGALSRLGQLYLVFSMAGSTLIAPYIARQKKEGLLNKYIFILGMAITISTILIGVAYFFPGLFLWLIGSKYNHLEVELVLLLISSGLGLINGTMWHMNASRKWIYYWMPIISISGVIIIESTLAFLLDLSTVKSVLIFMISVEFYRLLTRILVSFYGFYQERKYPGKSISVIK